MILYWHVLGLQKNDCVNGYVMYLYSQDLNKSLLKYQKNGCVSDGAMNRYMLGLYNLMLVLKNGYANGYAMYLCMLGLH